MVTRQPSVHLTVASSMRRPSRLRLLVSKCTVSSLRSKARLAQEATEAPPPPLPPKDVVISRTLARTDDSYAELSCAYAACSVFLSRELSAQHLGPRTPPRLARPAPPAKESPSPIVPTISPRMLSVAEIRQRRLEAAKRAGSDEPTISFEEARRQAQVKLEKQHLDQELLEKERQRKIILEEDLRQAAQIQREKAEREQREEEERRQFIEERRIADRERRQRQAQMHREYLERANQQTEDEKRRRLEARRHMIDERRTRPLPVMQHSGIEAADVGFEGWVTALSTGSVAWKRRYCRIEDGSVLLFKDDKSQSQLIQSVSVSSVRQIRERGDDLEELECLPHSFSLSVGKDAFLSMFTDSEEQKELLVSIIIQLANL